MFRKRTEFSGAIAQQFRPDDLHRYGVAGKILVLAYDPVQSLMVAGTDQGGVHVFGEGSVQVDFTTSSRLPIHFAVFLKGVYLAVIDAANTLYVWAMDTQEIWAKYNIPSRVAFVYADPAMDWLFLGHENGQVTVYDVDRGCTTSYRVDSIQKQLKPTSRMSPVVSLSLHPRDPGQILIAYHDLAAVFSFSENHIVFHCDVQKAGSFPSRIVQASWHPSGSHIVTCQNDGTIAFWDGQTGKHLCTREMHTAPSEGDISSATLNAKPFVRWCCRKEPENTFLVYGNGNTLSLIDFGQTPVVSVSSYSSMGKFFAGGRLSGIKLRRSITEAVVLPHGSPHYTGNYDPTYLIALLDNGFQRVVKLPELQEAKIDSMVLPPALAWIATRQTCVDVECVSRHQWTGMMMSAPRPFVRGGTTVAGSQRRGPLCTIFAIGGISGVVKLFDESKTTGGDFRVLETSITGLLPEEQNCAVAQISLAGSVAELAAASATGNVYLFSFKKNTPVSNAIVSVDPRIKNVAGKTMLELKEGFMPQWAVLNPNQSAPTALLQSDVGFVACGFDDGRMVVVDRRGPAIIFEEQLPPKVGHVTTFALGIAAAGQDSYSSILLAAGTTSGEVLVFKILPMPSGGYQVASYTSYLLGKDPVFHLSFIDLKQGKLAGASPEVMGQLSRGIHVTGGLLAVSSRDARLFHVTGTKPKGAHKSFDTPLLGAGFACVRQGDAIGLVVVNAKGKVTAYGIPGLSSLFTYQVPYEHIPGERVQISLNGDALVPLDSQTSACMGIWGVGTKPAIDTLYKADILVPARPTISAVTWLTGRQFVKVEDVDALLGGPRRPKSRRGDATVAVEDPTARPGAPARRPQQSRLPTSFDHPTPSNAASGTKTWGQTFNEYYDSAEGSLNETFDNLMTMVDDTKKGARNSAIKSVVKSKFGF